MHDFHVQLILTGFRVIQSTQNKQPNRTNPLVYERFTGLCKMCERSLSDNTPNNCDTAPGMLF